MEKLNTVLTRLRSKISLSDTDAVYETLRASLDSSEKLLSPRDREDVVHSLRNDLRKTRLRMKMLTTVLTSLVVFISLFWIMREFFKQGILRKLPIHSNAVDNVKFVYNKVPEVFSPAMEAVKYKEVVFHNNFRQDRTKWQGPPDDEVNKAWREIYVNIGVIKVLKADADRLLNATLPIPGEEDGYIITLEVYHQLHCLDLLRKHLYPDRYGADRGMSPRAKKKYWVYLAKTEHCINNLRQTIMCHSDVSTIPWINHELSGQFPDAHSTHVCRDFNKLTEWMLHPDRYFPQEEFQRRYDALHGTMGGH